MAREASEPGRCRLGAPVLVSGIVQPSVNWRLEAQESPDLGRAEILAVCFSPKAAEGQSASGMRGIFSAVQALEDICIVLPIVGAIHRCMAGGGAKSGE